ncbi:MAG: SMP-30/gluconolactonase/LRE family protein [Rhizobiaceae bacterium]|nr:SMP-30/gluconolactonase/LRE family protein [Hyphomicrobiales bacterium]NRB29721.1 SMP-30/gluconolactonase/LRE family protein [Rhizobiaceae bacterium]
MRIFGPRCTLGEGPLWHPGQQRLYWFDIPEGHLHACNAQGGQNHMWEFGEPASAAGWLDDDRLLVATASGLQELNMITGHWDEVISLEADNAITRSNDGRIGPDGSFWIGTMARDGSSRQGAYYRYHQGQLDCLAKPISIPNATCFSPDGRTAYLADTAQNLIWRWSLDESGNPIGDKEVHINLKADRFNPDGAVCDAEGYLWNAQWGAWRIVRYAPDGSEDRVIELPVSQPTCPAFGGADLKTLFITSACDGLSEKEMEKQPDAGMTLAIDLDVEGLPEHRALI